MGTTNDVRIITDLTEWERRYQGAMTHDWHYQGPRLTSEGSSFEPWWRNITRVMSRWHRDFGQYLQAAGRLVAEQIAEGNQWQRTTLCFEVDGEKVMPEVQQQMEDQLCELLCQLVMASTDRFDLAVGPPLGLHETLTEIFKNYTRISLIAALANVRKVSRQMLTEQEVYKAARSHQRGTLEVPLAVQFSYNELFSMMPVISLDDEKFDELYRAMANRPHDADDLLEWLKQDYKAEKAALEDIYPTP
ncbi:hypothetical protein DICA3_F28700 [Diutina catenulata]